jgi:hypothetical protein
MRFITPRERGNEGDGAGDEEEEEEVLQLSSNGACSSLEQVT